MSTSGSVGQIDSGWYLDVVRFAARTPWLHVPLALYTEYGLGLFGLLLVAAWWRARAAPDRTMAAALAGPVAVLIVYLADTLLKSAVAEVRPCLTLHVPHPVLPCDAPTDWSFPSNHAAIAGAVVAALFCTDRALGWVAVGLAAPLLFTRVYVGAHYPHDVVAGVLVGVVLATAAGLAGRRYLAPTIGGLRRTRLRPMLASTPRSTPDSAATTPRPATTTPEPVDAADRCDPPEPAGEPAGDGPETHTV